MFIKLFACFFLTRCARLKSYLIVIELLNLLHHTSVELLVKLIFSYEPKSQFCFRCSCIFLRRSFVWIKFPILLIILFLCLNHHVYFRFLSTQKEGRGLWVVNCLQNVLDFLTSGYDGCLLYINLACLSVCLFVCLYPINVKTAQPIGPKFFAVSRVTPGMVYG